MSTILSNSILQIVLAIFGTLLAGWLGAGWTVSCTAGLAAIVTAILGHYTNTSTAAKVAAANTPTQANLAVVTTPIS